jgi:hypothetical protein
MKNIKIAVLFLLPPLISSFSCQSFGNFGAGFVINVEGDFDKDIVIDGSFTGSCNIKSIKCEASVSLNHNGAIQKSITILPSIKNEQSPYDVILYSGAIATKALLNQCLIIKEKDQIKIDQLNTERKELANKRQLLHQATLEEKECAKEKVMAYLNQKNKDMI